MTDCEEEDDMSRSQSPMIPLTIENSSLDIKAEPCESDFLEGKNDDEGEDSEEEEDLNSSLTAMDWLPKLNARAGVVEEYVPEEERKPPYSYASLIRLAILNSPDQKATLSDIYKWIQNQFLYYKNQINLGWKNSIRHNLSLNKCFMKVARSRHDPGKGCYWAINHLYNHDKTPFEKRKKNLFHCDMLQQAAGFREMQLQRSFLQTLQTRQLQLLLTDSMSPSAASAMTSVYPPGPPPPLVEDKRYSPASNIIEDKRSSTDSDPCSMLLEDHWATTSEADLSPSLTRWHGMTDNSQQQMRRTMEAEEPVIANHQPPQNLCIAAPVQSNLMDSMETDMTGNWSGLIKTESSSIFNGVDPTEIMEPMSDIGPPAPAPEEPGKLPSLWSDVGRMSWLGANFDLFDWGRLREVPEQHDCDADDMINIDYDKLL